MQFNSIQFNSMLYLRQITFWIYCQLPITKTAVQGYAARTGQENNNNNNNNNNKFHGAESF
jgi:hypothetical protein